MSKAEATRRPGLRGTDWLFTALMLVLAVICLFLGNWQMARLSEKEALVAAVDQRLTSEPVPAPEAAEWPVLDMEQWNFQPVTLTGSYRYTQTVTVFTSLANARGRFSGPGYWVVTPFELDTGGTVFVNRGFVPQEFQEQAALGDLHGDDPGSVTIAGLFRPGEAVGFMAPEPNMSDRIEWMRNPERLAAMVDPALAPIAPYYVDLLAAGAGDLPQGGETVVSFTNNHFGYALTWYGFAIVAIVMLGFWLWRQRRTPDRPA
ncbi:surfeit locus 1 family protein [Devosia subaequoris]|uniref:SURF1-like protein n=1 Tax=Devosia subaequoris TaxID=395930 RepID=A0A7W6IP52_9HYPH|nr:SURF1 family protein [Devosia subaequoris]MBB4053255.1 surfeit locus 1 family protein [Devosia subaequoris]MCP1210614.1 SURF1 family protein [Devosia subaequoris]